MFKHQWLHVLMASCVPHLKSLTCSVFLVFSIEILRSEAQQQKTGVIIAML